MSTGAKKTESSGKGSAMSEGLSRAVTTNPSRDVQRQATACALKFASQRPTSAVQIPPSLEASGRGQNYAQVEAPKDSRSCFGVCRREAFRNGFVLPPRYKA